MKCVRILSILLTLALLLSPVASATGGSLTETEESGFSAEVTYDPTADLSSEEKQQLAALLSKMKIRATAYMEGR